MLIQKNTLFFITFIFASHIFGADFLKVEDASYFTPQTVNNLATIELRVFYKTQDIKIIINTIFYDSTKRRGSSRRFPYISSNDIYEKILEKISDGNTNKNIEITAFGQGEEIKINQNYYYKWNFLYNYNSFFVKDKQ